MRTSLPLKAHVRFVIFTFFSFKKFSLFFVWLHKEILEPVWQTFLACFMAWIIFVKILDVL